MHPFTVAGRPYVVLNGKDFAVLRWFDAPSGGPIFLQLSGRTPLAKEDLPTDDWAVVTTGDRTARVWTAWRTPWFDATPEARRRLAFLAASTIGSWWLALRYLALRAAVSIDPDALLARATLLATRSTVPWALTPMADRGLTSEALVVLDPEGVQGADTLAELLGLPSPDPVS